MGSPLRGHRKTVSRIRLTRNGSGATQEWHFCVRLRKAQHRSCSDHSARRPGAVAVAYRSRPYVVAAYIMWPSLDTYYVRRCLSSTGTVPVQCSIEKWCVEYNCGALLLKRHRNYTQKGSVEREEYVYCRNTQIWKLARTNFGSIERATRKLNFRTRRVYGSVTCSLPGNE